MRGTLSLSGPALMEDRITPAHAGNTGVLSQYKMPDWDHPRPCGEHEVIAWQLMPKAGSPPPMRGTRIKPIKIRHDLGITPAHAGNTIKVPNRNVRPQDHPRPCGEHTVL